MNGTDHPDHGGLVGATILTADLDGTAARYQRHFGWQTAFAGPVSAAEATLWQDPALPGRRQIVLQAPGNREGWLRLVESPGRTPPPPMRRLGWSAIELAVRDVDSLGPDFAAPDWQVLGPPADLSFTDAIRAMQVAGPAGEVFYLTQIKRQLPGFDLPETDCRIDRPFVLILGSRSVPEAMAFYSTLFARPAGPAFPVVIRVINGAWDLPADHPTLLGTLTLGGQSLIEFDGFPADAAALPAGEMPAGIAMGSFLTAIPAAGDGHWLSPPVALPHAPYRGRLAGVVRGPDGERTELIQLPE
jgi:hypothetical protein